MKIRTRPPLQLDHFAPARRPSPGGWAVLAVALATVAGLAVYQRGLFEEAQALETFAAQKVRVAATRSPSAGAAGAQRTEEAARRADQIAHELRLPWTEIFDAVEAAVDPSVALLSVEPDTRATAIRVTGEARDKLAMLEYVLRLGAQPPFIRATLESHADRGTGARSPVLFTLIASWEPPR